MPVVEMIVHKLSFVKMSVDKMTCSQNVNSWNDCRQAVSNQNASCWNECRWDVSSQNVGGRNVV